MRQFNTLTGFLLSKSSNPTTDDTVTFEGYAAIGDGGAATWQHNGVTGQTPSQSPAQLSDGLLNDGSGNQWSLVSDGKIILKSLGAVGNGVNDDTLSIIAWWNAALSALALSEKQTAAPTAYAPSGNYLSSEGLVLEANKY